MSKTEWQRLTKRLVDEIGVTRAAAAAGVREQTILQWLGGHASPVEAATHEYRLRIERALDSFQKTGKVIV